jgi:plastocyanin
MRLRSLCAALMLSCYVAACDYYYNGPDGVTGPPPPAADSTAVLIRMVNNAFAPDTDTVVVGAVVTWRNFDTTAHTVTTVGGTPEAFDSGDIPDSTDFEHTMLVAGVYPYFCRHHGTATTGMRGVLIVR